MAANLHSEWARLAVDGLVQAGVGEAIISPGSRSTPLVIAALKQKGLRCIHAIDERTAAFYALGQARVTGRPSVLICTSGSAAAHYLPAVVEASEAGVPLVILSADRPTDLKHCGANQTTEQRTLFGSHARMVADLGRPDPAPRALRAVRRLCAQAVATALQPKMGPVHLNAPFSKPLSPGVVVDDDGRQARAAADAILASPATRVHQATATADAGAVAQLARALGGAERPVVIAGPAPLGQGEAWPALRRVCAAFGAPLFAEATSQFRFAQGAAELAVAGFDAIYKSEEARSALAPDFVVQLGAPTVSSGLEALLGDQNIERAVLTAHLWPDPHSDARQIVVGDVGATLSTLAEQTEPARPSAWQNRWSELSRAYVDNAKSIAGNETLTEANLPTALFECLPAGTRLSVGNSLPIRQVDAWVDPSDKPVGVLSQRGVSGIDGMVSGAAGSASVVRQPLALLVGDVSFVHDVGGLLLASNAEAPLLIVVVNNGGGRIFDQLPVARRAPEHMKYFTTPLDIDLSDVVRGFGVCYAEASRRAEFSDACKRALQSPGCTVLEAKVDGEQTAVLNDTLSRMAHGLVTGG